MSTKKLAGKQPGALDVVHFGGRRCGGERKPGCPWNCTCRTIVALSGCTVKGDVHRTIRISKGPA